jgi:hypothetical protein
MDPVQDQIQRTVTSLIQLHRTHGILVASFVALLQRKSTYLESAQTRVDSAQQQIERWDIITSWTWLVFGKWTLA